MRRISLFAIILTIMLGVILFYALPWDSLISTKEEKQETKSEEKVTEVNEEEKQQEIELDYTITIDEERYKWVQKEEADFLTTKEPLEEKYPEVSMTIEHYRSITPGKLIPALENKMTAEYSNVTETEAIIEPVKGYKIHAIHQENGASTWDSPVSNIYIIDSGYGGSFVITEKYFLEAAEGHGANFYHMLKTFKILKKNTNS